MLPYELGIDCNTNRAHSRKRRPPNQSSSTKIPASSDWFELSWRPSLKKLVLCFAVLKWLDNQRTSKVNTYKQPLPPFQPDPTARLRQYVESNSVVSSSLGRQEIGQVFVRLTRLYGTVRPVNMLRKVVITSLSSVTVATGVSALSTSHWSIGMG